MKILSKLNSLDNVEDGSSRKIPSKVGQLENDKKYTSSNTVIRIEVVDQLPDVQEENVLYMVKNVAPPPPEKVNLYYQTADDLYESSGSKYVFNVYKNCSILIDTSKFGTPLVKDKEKHSNGFNVTWKKGQYYTIRAYEVSGDIVDSTTGVAPTGSGVSIAVRQEANRVELVGSSFRIPGNVQETEWTFQNNDLEGSYVMELSFYLYGKYNYNNLKFFIELWETNPPA